MEVLKKGEAWSLNIMCTGNGNGNGGCGSLLKVSAEDLFLTYGFAYGFMDQPTYITIKCPVCNIYTDLDARDIPHQIRTKVKQKNHLNV